MCQSKENGGKRCASASAHRTQQLNTLNRQLSRLENRKSSLRQQESDALNAIRGDGLPNAMSRMISAKTKFAHKKRALKEQILSVSNEKYDVLNDPQHLYRKDENGQVFTNFSGEIRDQFTSGDCWILAHTLSTQSNWEMVGIGVDIDSGEEDDGFRDFCHVAVRRPDGMIVDIEGVHSSEHFLKRWQNTMRKNYDLHNTDEERANYSPEIFPIPRDGEYWENLTDDMEPVHANSHEVSRHISAEIYALSR